MAPPPVGQHRADAVLGAEHHALQVHGHDPLVLSTVVVGQRRGAPMPATLSTASTRPNASTAAANIASTESSSVTSTWNGTDGVAQGGGRVVLLRR